MPEIVTGNFAPFRFVICPPGSLRIVDWNVDRGQHLQGVIDFLASTNAGILILQEVDLNACRPEAADELCVGRELQELVQESKTDPAYHGQAILAKWPISNPRLIRFSRQSKFWQPHWFLRKIEPFQERLGGRIALVAEITVAGSKVVIYNLHLESKGDDDLRLAQIEEVLLDAMSQKPERPVIIAGDFNLDASKDSAASAFAKTGFQEAISAPRTPTAPSRSFEPARRVDWAFIRGPVRAGSGKVHNQVRASDHYPISLTLTLSRN